MTSTEALAAEIRRAVSGEPWFGPALTEQLAGVDARRAAARVSGGAHSIWEIVLHVAVWARYATHRFEGGLPYGVAEEDDWPPVTDASETAWAAARGDALDACEQAARAVAALGNQALDAIDSHPPTDAEGQPVTLRRIAAGLAQHVAYHAGQIAVLKSMLASRDVSAVPGARSVLERLFAAGDAGDLDAFDELMADDVVVHAPAGLSTRGAASEKESWRAARAAMPGLRHEFVDVLVAPTVEAARAVVTGTFDGAYGGLAARNRPFRFDQAVFAHVRDGRIVEMWEIVDVDALRRQLGDD